MKEQEKKPQSPQCTEPWHVLHLGNNGIFRPCCNLVFESDITPSSKEDVSRIFNSLQMVYLRKQLSTNDIRNPVCQKCLSGEILPGPTNTKELGSIYKDFPEAKAKVQGAMERGDAFLDYLPLKYGIAISYACNLKCIMCVQSYINDSRMFKRYPIEGLIRALREIGGSNIAVLDVVGGEPFNNKDGLELLDFCKDPMFKNTKISVSTNGLNIDKHIDLIKDIEKISIAFSIEGTGPIYENIRIGSNWEKLADNYKMLWDLRKEKEGLTVFAVMSIIMRSSIPGLADLVEFVGSNGGRFDFVRCSSELFYENVFLYPSLLEDIRWERHMLDAISMAAKYGLEPEILSLTNMMKDMKKRFVSPNQDIINNEIQRLVRLCNLDFEQWNVYGRNKKKHISRKEIINNHERFFRWLKKCDLELDKNSSQYFGDKIDKLINMDIDPLFKPQKCRPIGTSLDMVMQ
ncbi:MAG: radical SAM protein [Proteobacteria bacterium]|nr:radical SAM protein [Pseudomonadota bacterium]